MLDRGISRGRAWVAMPCDSPSSSQRASLIGRRASKDHLGGSRPPRCRLRCFPVLKRSMEGPGQASPPPSLVWVTDVIPSHASSASCGLSAELLSSRLLHSASLSAWRVEPWLLQSLPRAVFGLESTLMPRLRTQRDREQGTSCLNWTPLFSPKSKGNRGPTGGTEFFSPRANNAGSTHSSHGLFQFQNPPFILQ